MDPKYFQIDTCYTSYKLFNTKDMFENIIALLCDYNVHYMRYLNDIIFVLKIKLVLHVTKAYLFSELIFIFIS